ncbi:MAG: hypothetical protein ACD_66C00162G0003 [uncultured bacterium]|nr:MAG: hypothetical protein ACD_66C00162G0003 [uncultured bacterium]
MKNETILLDLIRLQSSQSVNSEDHRVEYEVTKYLRKFIKKYLPSFTLEEQEVASGRHNLYIYNAQQVDLLFVGHMDTVPLGSGWTVNPLGEIKEGKIFGRGSADMKAGIVAILSALVHAEKSEKSGVGALFYVDEEYYFKGMKAFSKKYATTISPKLIVDPEPTQGKLRNAVRGISEICVEIKGLGGHAAKPNSGISAYGGLDKAIEQIERYLSDKKNSILGFPTLNVAKVECGSLQGFDETGEPIFGMIGNVIPDYCKALLEVRMVPNVNSEGLIEQIERGVKSAGCTIQTMKVNMDLGSFVTKKKDLKLVEEVQKEVMGIVDYQDPQQGGYVDVQMLAQVCKCPVVIWGPSGENMHAPDEYVEISSLFEMEKVFTQLVDRLCR